MRSIRERKSWIAAIAIVVLFGACKGESPTAPPTGGGNPPGGTTPPTGVSLTVTVSNTDPLIDSTSVITATATLNGQPVPNGTAVEFETNLGTFDPTGDVKTTVKTTADGVATVTLTSSEAGPAVIRATVNNVSRTVSVTFREAPIVIPPPSLNPTISSVTPSIGRPSGGESIRIAGSNFKSPVRVLFSTGVGTSPIEAFVVATSETTIDVLTPAFNVGAGQQFVSDVIVITEAGSSREQRVTKTGAFTFRNETLTPRVSTATPNSGPVTGGTRVTIIGDGFQAPVQVLFGAAEAKVITVNFAEILVEAPAGRDTAPDGSGAVTGPVDITVRNISSATSVTLPGGFRYINAMQITAAGPTEGLFTGGTRVQIDGVGFVAPVAVVIGGIAAQPINVSGTRIIALTSGVAIDGCDDVEGPISVTNIANGDTASGPDFTFRVPKPLITSVSPSTVTAGGVVTITVANAFAGAVRIKLGTKSVFPSGASFNPDGSASYTVAVPTNFEFPEEACGPSDLGTQQGSLDVDVSYENLATGCTDVATEALTVDPLVTTCVLPPPPNASVTPTTSPGSCAPVAAPVSATGTATVDTTFTVTNTGEQPLIISSVTVVSATNATTMTVAPTGATLAPQASQTFTVTTDPAAAGTYGGTIRINSNDPDSPAIDFCFEGTAGA